MTPVSVTAAVIIESGNILIAQRKPGDRLAGKWEFPGGKVRTGESLEACLRREIREELEMDIRVGTCLGKNVFHNGRFLIALWAFLSERCAGQPVLNDHQDVRWVPPHRLAEYDFAPGDLPFVRRLTENAAMPAFEMPAETHP